MENGQLNKFLMDKAPNKVRITILIYLFTCDDLQNNIAMSFIAVKIDFLLNTSTQIVFRGQLLWGPVEDH